MANLALNIDALSTEERISLIDELWSSLDGADLRPTVAQQRELNRRLDRLDQTGPLGSPLEEVMDRLGAKAS